MTAELDTECLCRDGVSAIVINTGRFYRLDSKIVAGGIQRFFHGYKPSEFNSVLVGNVRNLVCSAKFKVGEYLK